MTARRLHRILALMLALFLALHVFHHATLLGGTDLHLSVQRIVSPLYRWLPIEAVLLAVLALQIGLGARLGWVNWARAKGWRRVQILSGGGLGLFVVIHVSATLMARAQGLDTTVNFAAAGLFHPIWRWFFILYYPAGILALVTHFASHLALRRIGPWWLARALPACGVIYAAVVVTGLLGGFGGPPPPPEYLFSGSLEP